MKSAFSLLELIFAIVILGIIASFAVPKYMDTKDSALISTIKRDINTSINSIQSYYLLNQKIEKISDTMNINDTNWIISDLKMQDKNSCLSLEVKTSDLGSKTIELTVDDTKEITICKKLRDAGLISKTYELY
ncbi:MAG: prepilin-type N-terminal cleavage/methylation domain-containing protein [Arcobacter sp.]|jgi:general secretion pathway protein G|uniref:type II secretion system protein n=1 Tax=Arcobacter sp. TaxID=1872629 RepID=UPI0025909D41|nr:prepilin-type N-terminal cleavage/methylation domain-containing protein [Arcobacter sp.]MDD3009098.1 prepilin-type N-terminal cleavage/methylation domain-containing protein [Arcobacter sp.]MDY3203696.1 prepilin-type N-terminal cleavage/methylation domain-containing protein [Arcobacter sp.]